jgi:hypothetical protein
MALRSVQLELDALARAASRALRDDDGGMAGVAELLRNLTSEARV